MRVQLAPLPAVVVSSRDAAREAFTRHDRRLAARYTPDAVRARGWADRSMIYLPSTDPLWRTQRSILTTHVLAPRSLAARRGVRERKVRDLVDHFRARAGNVVDVGKAMYGAMINLVSSAFFSVDVLDLDATDDSAHGIREHVEGLGDLMTKPNISDLFPFLRRLDLQGRRRMMGRHVAAIFSIVDGVIDRRLAEIDRDVAKAIVFELFITGGETVTVTVEWAMAELLKNPRTMAKVRAEIDGALGDKTTIDESDAASLPYLMAVEKEGMRLHPVAPVLVPHLAVEDGVEIGGYEVPKGSTVIFNVGATMRDPATWDRPDEFVPERFLDTEVDYRGKDFEFLPFGSGRRQCPGLPLAERVVPHLLASLLHAFEWRLPDGMSPEQLDVSEKFTTANVLAVPLKAVPIVIT
ncbi:hypothetical protein EJB05_06513, partial [Eragrostis curvula]